MSFPNKYANASVWISEKECTVIFPHIFIRVEISKEWPTKKKLTLPRVRTVIPLNVMLSSIENYIYAFLQFLMFLMRINVFE